MSQPTLISHDVQLQVVDLRDFVSAPILALVEADIKVAKRFVRFIENYGFEKHVHDKSGDHLGQLKTITFRYKRPIRQQQGKKPGIDEEWITVHIPLLSLIPLPLLQIMDAELEYGFHIISIVEEAKEKDAQDQSGNATSVEPSGDAYRLECMVAPLDRTGSMGEYLRETLDLNLKVTVRVKRADIPAGVATLLNLMEDATYGNQSNGEAD